MCICMRIWVRLEKAMIRLEHAGLVYQFDPDSEVEAAVEWEGDMLHSDRQTLIYKYALNGAHQGPSLKVHLVGIESEVDEDGARIVWNHLAWAIDGERIEDGVVDDFYHDALREDLDTMVRETGWQ